MKKQQVFDFHQTERLSWNDFVESKENRETLAYLRYWQCWNVHSLIIYGETGVGKTHLAALWAQSANAIYVLPKSVNHEPRELFENDCNFVIDNFDDFSTLVNSNWMFHFMNILKEKQRFLLITSRVAPIKWKIDLPDLRSRLLLIPAQQIAPPSDALLFDITKKLSRDLGIVLDDRSIQYMLNNITRDVNTVKKVLRILNKLSLEKKQSLNLAFMRRYLHATQVLKA